MDGSRFHLLTLQRKQPASADLAAFIREIEALQSPLQQCVASLSLAMEAAPSAIEGMLDELNHLPAHSIRFVVERQLVFRWLAHEPERAMRWVIKKL